MNRTSSLALILGVVAPAMVAACQRGPQGEAIGVAQNNFSFLAPAVNSGSYNLHLENSVRFNPTQPGADPTNGRALFGLAADLNTSDPTLALFQGPSQAFGGTVVSNGRTCFTCHRGLQDSLGLPPPPLSATIPLTDPLFTGINADAAGDPDAMYNLDQLGLVKYRPNRFNLTRSESDPFRQAFGWRKSIRLVNVGFAHGFLSDGRARDMFETARGAVFNHTQSSDNRFDDLFTVQNGNDMEAFQFSIFSDPRLASLLDPSDPMYTTLVNEPFYTVAITTPQQARGRDVFVVNCMSCHNTPNVFNNIANVDPLGNATRPPNYPSFAPAVGHLYDIGVAERNRFNLRFTYNNGNGTVSPIVLPLANEDGSTTMLALTFDPGLGLTTARTADIGRFKVPQLRGVAQNAPYFHDNSALSLAEVVDYFNSDYYNNSRDGQQFPIHLNTNQRADLLAFLQIL